LDTLCTTLAFVLLFIAAGAFLFGKTDAAFVLGTLGAVAWFVGFRFRLRQTHSEPQTTEGLADDSDDSYED
jgi:hypothetical protein